ncbi:MAG: ImmA/IrrE family metallo-endopeptidase [Chloracidobacterium sp.]|nr:ImmA/IrrE family metallo-endopeptidase [Chloracidobacterium sp.]
MSAQFSPYYEQMKQMAGEKRSLYNIDTSKIDLNVIRAIYRKEGIRIDQWPFKGGKIKAIYIVDEDGPSVAIRNGLPREPKAFALVHELKHHYVDQDAIRDGKYQCGSYNENEMIEVGAEVFAAQFIYPDDEMLAHFHEFGVPQTGCTAESIVRFKKICPALVSYKFLVKRFERFGRIEKGLCASVQFTKLEEQIFGLPIHKRPSFIRNRKRRSK